MGNSAPQCQKLHNQVYLQFSNQAFHPPSDFHPPHHQWQSSPYSAGFKDIVLVALSNLAQLLHSKSQSLAKLEFQMELTTNALNQIEEVEFWSQSEVDPIEQYMIDEDASSSSHDELVQANIPLSSERIIDNEVEERRNELVLTFEPL
jgi:hypothetical protein